jgi:aminoglycoside phosphotransferase (APT) family kinase protein
MTDLIREYVKNSDYRKALGLPDSVIEEYTILARGEYNINYLFRHPADGRQLVLRVNAGSQMHLDRQIEYEAHALRLLSGCGRTPRVYYVDGSGKYIDHGILVEEYLPGRHPRYGDSADMNGVMECMADIHAVPVPADEVIYGEPETVPRDTVRLIAPADPAAAILDECEAMVVKYMQSPLGSEATKGRLRALLDRAHEIADEGGKAGTYRCCINTELNSTNFLVDRDKVRLVDWEKPLYGDPAQDLGHLLAPTTTFWKTDDILSSGETDRLIDEYIKAVGDRFDTAGIRERTHRLINVTCLRGLTWCAMAWVEYQDPDKLIVNESTRKKLDAYLSDGFLSGIEERLFRREK